jgi:hypothetical protein
MHRERVGERRRIRIFEAATLKISAKTCGGAGLERNPIDIPVFITSFSDVP